VTVNKMIAAGEYVAATQLSGGRVAAPQQFHKADTIKVKNTTAGVLAQGSVVQIGTYLLATSQIDQQYLWFNGDEPSSTGTGKFAILTTAAKATDIVPAWVSGPCIARVNVTSTSHTHASVESGETHLVSGDSGPVLLLHTAGSTGTQLMAVVIDRGGATAEPTTSEDLCGVGDFSDAFGSYKRQWQPLAQGNGDFAWDISSGTLIKLAGSFNVHNQICRTRPGWLIDGMMVGVQVTLATFSDVSCGLTLVAATHGASAPLASLLAGFTSSQWQWNPRHGSTFAIPGTPTLVTEGDVIKIEATLIDFATTTFDIRYYVNGTLYQTVTSTTGGGVGWPVTNYNGVQASTVTTDGDTAFDDFSYWVTYP
jgi:hypothetical protein